MLAAISSRWSGLYSTWNACIFAANCLATSGGISSGFRLMGITGE